MQSQQSKIEELKTGAGQWRVVVGFVFAGTAAVIALHIYFFAVSKLGWNYSIPVGVVLLAGLAAIPKFFSQAVQISADKMFSPSEIFVCGDPIHFVFTQPVISEISNIFTPPVTPPRRALA